jgi:hypothetical protein
MATYFTSNRFLLFISVGVFLIMACNNKTDEKATQTTDTASTAANTSQVTPPLRAGLAGGPLDTLFVDSASFAKLAFKKLVLVFTFRSNDTLTLHGWSADHDINFGTDPDIELQKHSASAVNYGPDMYFGNVILQKQGIKRVQDSLEKRHAHAVLFAPRLVGTTHIGYDIFISDGSPFRGEKVATVTGTGVGMNPSPPKTY